MSDVNPWDRKKEESNAAYEAFLLYRDQPMGTRTAHNVAVQLSKSDTIIKRWSAAFDWRARARAWDEHLQQVADAETVQEIRDWKADIRATTTATQNRIALRLQTEELQPLQLKHLMEAYRIATELGRFSRGLSEKAEGVGTSGVQLVKTLGGIDEDVVLGADMEANEDEEPLPERE